MDYSELPARLRAMCEKLRRTPIAIIDVVPMLQEAADCIDAQRAAPGAQGGEPTPWRNEMMDMAIAAGVAPNTIFHFEAAFLRFAESLEKKINTAQSPQHSAQPVVVATVVEELEHDGEGFCAKVRWLFNPVPVGEQLFWGQENERN